MTNPYPIPRQARQTAILLGDGGPTYGPFGFKIFDVEDVAVYTRPDGEEVFSPVAVTVAKVDDLPFDLFTIEFADDLPETTEFVVASERQPMRDAGVDKGTRIDMTALEKELSKIASFGQELRRDISRSMKVDFGGEEGLTVSSALLDGDTLMKSGNFLVKGPNATDITNAALFASTALTAQMAAEQARDAINQRIYLSVSAAEDDTIPAAVKRLYTQFRTTARIAGSAANYRRVTPAEFVSKPTQSYFRSTDRFMPDGSTDSANGGYWMLDEALTTPQMLGAAADGVTDDAAAIVAAQAFGKPVVLDGAYLVRSQLAFNGQTILRGYKRDKSKLIWPADAASFGLKLTPSSWNDWIEVQNIGIWTRGTSGTPLEVDFSALPTSGIPYFDPRCVIRGNDIRGETVGTQGFATGIVLKRQFGARVEDNFIQGIYVGGDLLEADFPSDVGIHVPDQSVGTLANLHIRGNVIFGFKTAAKIYNVEGVWYQDNDMQVCFDGLICDNTIVSGGSVVRLNQYRVTGNHFGVSNTQAYFRRCRQVLFEANEVSYRYGRTGGAALSLIVYDSVTSGCVMGNSIRGNVLSDTDVVLSGVALTDTTGVLNTQYITVEGNQFQNLAYAIVNRATANLNTFGPGNNYNGIRVQKLLNENTNSAIQPGFMGSGEYIVPAGQNPAAVFTGKNAASIFINRDTDGAVAGISHAGTTVGTITQTATGTAYNVTSDMSAKDDQGEMSLALARQILDLITFHEFKWKVNGETDYGVFAQELHPIYPWAVTPGGWVYEDGSTLAEPRHEEEPIGYMPWQVDYSKLVTVIARCVQGALATMDDLATRLAVLESA